MYQRYVKRTLDTVLSIAVMIITVPLAVIVALLIKATSRGPVLFSQIRTGLHGEDFTIYKFRTMTCNNDVYDSSNENQLTEVGRLIRSLSIDEIPQLINIVKGQMSLIGPRPWIPDYYIRMKPNQRKRCDVLPGITGLAQVNGRNSISVHVKIKYDLMYVKRISLREDFKIIYLTFSTILKKGSREIAKSGIHNELLALLGDERG